MYPRSLKALLLAAPAVLIFSSEGHAQTAPAETPAQAAAPASAVALEELVVTARRREENVQTTPVAVTALSAETLREKAISDVQELSIATPSLTTTSIFSTTHVNFSMRGRSAENNQFGNQQVVEVYFSDVPQMSAPLAQFYDLQSVQVLRGPQGTLFGRASNGGAVLFAPNMPSGDFEGYAQVQVGNYDDLELEGAVSFPIIQDVLSARIAGNIVRRDGYTRVLNYDNLDLDDAHSNAARLSTRFTPTSWLSNELVWDHIDVDQNLGGTFLLAARPGTVGATLLSPSFPNYQLFLEQNPDLAAIPGVAGGLLSYVDTVAALGPRKLYLNAPRDSLIFQETLNVVSNKTVIDAGFATITNIFGYQRERRAQGYNADGTPLPLLNGYTMLDLRPNSLANKRHQYTDELRVNGDLFDGRLDWLVGGFYQELRDETPGNTLTGAAVTVTGAGATYVANRITKFSRALFAHGSFQITDALRVSAGYRRTWETNKSVQAAVAVPLSLRGEQNGPAVCIGTAIPADFDLPQCQGARGNLKARGDNWIVGLDYKVTDALFAYGSISRGFKPGGINTTATIPALRSYGTETIKQYELGLKFQDELADIPVRVNLALYQQDLNDAQVGYVVFNPFRRTTEGVSLNAPSARVRGIEVEGEAVFSRWFRLSAFFDYTDAKYTEFGIPVFVVDPTAPGGVTVASVTDVSANPFPNTPKYHFGTTARVHFPVPEDWGDLSLSATYFYQSSIVFSSDLKNEFEGVAGSYDLLNAQLEWRNVFGRPVDVTAFVKNATNNTYLRGGIALAQQLGFTHTTYGEPRMYGVQLRYRFGAGQ